MKIDFSKIPPMIQIDGVEINNKQPIHEAIGNVIYQHARDLNLVDIARSIFRGEEVEVRDNELKEIESLLIGPNGFAGAFARKAVKDFIATHRPN